MGLFSFLRKNKQEPTAGESEFYSRAEETPVAPRRARSKKGAAGNEPVDPVLPEKKRARRRLVGALALVLAAIIGLPMVLDSEPKPLTSDIAIDIPSKDKPLPVTGARMAAPGSLDKGEEIVSATQGQTIPPATQPGPAIAAATAGAAMAAATAPSTAQSGSGVKQSPGNEVKTPLSTRNGDKPAEKTSETRTNTPSEADRARAILEGKSAAVVEKVRPAQETKPARFVVQVAALASQDKVKEVQGKLKSAGVSSYTQKVATENGERIRVRVGPFASKDEAEKMRARLAKLGLSPTLVPA